MKQKYFYLTGICEFSGKPLIITTDKPTSNTNHLLIQVVNVYGDYTEEQLIKIGNKIEYKKAQEVIAELKHKWDM